MLEKFLKPELLGGGVADAVESIRQGVPSAVFNVSFPHKCHIVSALGCPVLYVVKDVLTIDKAKAEIESLSGAKVAALYPKDDVLLYKKAFSKHGLYKRLNGLYDMQRGASVTVTTFEAIFQLFPKNLGIISLKKGQVIEPQEVVKSLVKLGYNREEIVSGEGSFSLRGDILEVFPINCKNPLRIDFFGDEIENIKEYDLSTRDKIRYVDNLEILTATDVIIDESEVNSLVKEIKSYSGQCKNADAYARIQNISRELIDSLESNTEIGGFSVLMPLLKNTSGNVLDFMPDDTVVIFDECKQLSDGLELILKEHKERCKNLILNGEAFGFSYYQFSDEQEVIANLITKRTGALQTLTTAITFFNPLKTFTLRCGTVARYQMKFNEFLQDVNNWLFSGYRILVVCDTPERAKKMNFDLSDNGIASSIDTDNPSFTGVAIVNGVLENGFIYHENKIAVIGSGDLYARKPAEKKLKKKKNEFFSAPEAGDYAVHEIHGIGVVRGTKRISTTEGTKDYIAVEYSGGDVLYVPVEQMDVLSRYLGGEKKPSLSKIGGKDFERVKERVKASLKAMSVDLKKLYSERSEKVGFVFTEDSEMQEVFENGFPYELTDDQKQASQEIMEDMCSAKVMDRLVCGDVGYGKTEVAFRAVFRAIVSGKQAALLAPTTVLAEQHFNTAVERFKNFGVNIAVLNRFKTDKEQTNILKSLKEGKIDFIIGTHRLLGSDVAFKDLGLLVLDEEQRFGVEHKEKIKLLKNNVDTLTLSATPIPRTLHMSLSGIRDISTINTPPKERLPVQTYVTEETDALIKDAVTREINRGGQAFILYNRVESINGFAKKMKELLPDVRFTVAHGRMDERSLENAIMTFYAGETDALISTTIIENGIDLPKANTIIVIDADRLGLSTLYQLKGRVGRSNRLAHAYFTFKREKVLSETAYKRLTAIMEFTEMGSGIKIAMRDLEIRGAGNVLGREQHGHMDKVGYELYTKLLKEEMGEQLPTVAELDIRVSAYIPEDYISSSSGRMDAYKEIAEIASDEDEQRVVSSLTDLYGELPMEVEDLITIASVKRMAATFGATEITVKGGQGEIVFPSLEAFNNGKLVSGVEKFKSVCKLNLSVKPIVEFYSIDKTNGEILKNMSEFLKFSIKLQ